MPSRAWLEPLAGVVGELGIPCHWPHQGCVGLCLFDGGDRHRTLNWWRASGEQRLVADPQQRRDRQARRAWLLIRRTPAARF